MHQALKVPEIFQLILLHIHNPREARSHHGLREVRPGAFHRDISTLASLARTCKYLSKPSLDVLWYYQIDLRPLLKCLPGDLLRRQDQDYYTEKFGLKRELRRQDFARVDLYARRIRILGDPKSARVISSLHREDIDATIYSKIVSGRSLWGLGPFLPSLSHLRIGLEKFCTLAWYPRLIIGPQLQVINLVGFREDMDAGKYEIDWENMFTVISPNLPSLHSLSFSVHAAYSDRTDGDIYTLEGSKEIQMKIIQAILSPTVLDMISVPLDAKTFHYIANLQTIEVLTISIVPIDPDNPLVQNLPELPNLIELRVEANEPRFCSAIIRQIGSRRLRTLGVVRLETTPYLWSTDWFIQSLEGARFVSSIDALEIITPAYRISPNPNIPPITHDTIRRLSHFKNLRSIRLHLNGEVHLGVDGLEAIASIWPNLQVLDLRTRTRLGEADPELSFNDLLVVAAKLPALKEVRLQVDAQKEPSHAAIALLASGIAAPELEILDVCTSPILTFMLGNVGTLLGAVFPNLQKLLYGWQWPARNGQDLLVLDLSLEEEYSLKSWRRVRKMLLDY